MNIVDSNMGNKLFPLKLTARETPHFVLEPTMECNIQCRSCYNQFRDYRKSFQEIVKEIDLACHKRNLDTVSILGGEPTLHPDLPRVVSHIKDRKLNCQLLSNGIRFAEKDGGRLIDQLIAAGVDRFILHADIGQKHLHEDTAAFCRSIFDKFESRGVYFSLSATLYRENLLTLPEQIKNFARYKFFDGILATLHRDSRQIVAKNPPPPGVNLEAVHANLQEKLNLRPTSYLPTSLNDHEVSWLIYFYYFNTSTGKTFSLSSRLTRFFRRSYRVFAGRHLFGSTLNPRWFSTMLWATGIAEILISPKRIKDFMEFLRGYQGTKNLRFHYLVAQRGPEFKPDQNSVEICYHCPDATIRNGKLTPVCLADVINPLPGDSQSEPVDWMARSVFDHLEEA